MSYPAELGLARMGVRPYQGAWLDGEAGRSARVAGFRELTAPSGGEAGEA